MDYFQGVKTCTTNLENYLPDSYKEITHNTVAEMLMDEIISTWNPYYTDFYV